jgi:hypothetical protein
MPGLFGEWITPSNPLGNAWNRKSGRDAFRRIAPLLGALRERTVSCRPGVLEWRTLDRSRSRGQEHLQDRGDAGEESGIHILGAKPNVWIRDSLIRGHTGTEEIGIGTHKRVIIDFVKFSDQLKSKFG